MSAAVECQKPQGSSNRLDCCHWHIHSSSLNLLVHDIAGSSSVSIADSHIEWRPRMQTQNATHLPVADDVISEFIASAVSFPFADGNLVDKAPRKNMRQINPETLRSFS